MNTEGPDRELHITIGTAPSPGVDLTGELRSVKGAILYGDKATPHGVAVSAVLSLQSTAELDMLQGIRTVES